MATSALDVPPAPAVPLLSSPLRKSTADGDSSAIWITNSTGGGNANARRSSPRTRQPQQASPKAMEGLWKLTKEEWHSVFLIIKEHTDWIGKPKLIWDEMRKPQYKIKIPEGATLDTWTQKWTYNRRKWQKEAAAYAATLDDDAADWADGSDAFELAVAALPALERWRNKWFDPKLAWWVSHHCWALYDRKIQKKGLKESREDLLSVGDRHLQDGLGGKRGVITKEERARNIARLTAEGASARNSKMSIKAQYQRALSSAEKNRSAKLDKRKNARAKLQQGTRFDDDDDESGAEDVASSGDSDDGGSSLRKREEANKRLKKARAKSAKPSLSSALLPSRYAPDEERMEAIEGDVSALSAKMGAVESKLDSLVALLTKQHQNK
jgi:hypothetical protein